MYIGIAQIDDATLRIRAKNANLFCRVTPSEKERIIRILKARDHEQAIWGDRINNAPLLYSAGVGLSVGATVDVARKAADMMLLESNLSVIHTSAIPVCQDEGAPSAI